MMINRRGCAIIVFLLFTFNLVSAAASSPALDCGGYFSSGWPSDRSDLQPDPALVRGELANGMRYAVMENHEPENRVALYLYIHAGSINEKEEQRGVAHFLEHMLFNGTTHFRPGELVKFFQDIGMSFGGDTNARTGYDETVFNILLPGGADDVLRKGFLVMSDYARGALLPADEVDRERGVILAEKRSRDSAAYRAFVAAGKFRYRGTLVAEREIIGDDTVLRQADSGLLRDYYDSWYRPENMLLVVVGDITGDKVVPLISEMFSPLSGKGEPPACPEIGKLDHSALEVFYHHEGELGKTEVSIESLWNVEPKNDSGKQAREELYRYASIMMLNNRLKKLQEKNGEVLSFAGYYSGDMLQRIRYSTITASTSAGKWSGALGLIESTLRQALVYGFLQDEIDRVKKDIMSGLESAVLTKKSRDSEHIGREIIRQFGDNRVFRSPEQELELYSGILAGMTPEMVNALFRADWSAENRLVLVHGDAVIAAGNPLNTISTAYREHAAREVAPFAEQGTATFPYLTPETVDGSVIAAHRKIVDIDAEQLVFTNNIAVTLKKTNFEPNTVRVVVDVGRGKLSEPAPGLAMLGRKVINDSGTATLPRSALADVLAGTTLNVNFAVSEESLRWTGEAVASESELLLQLLYSLLQDPAVREQAWVSAGNELKQMYGSMEKDIEGAIHTKVDRFLAGGDQRAGLPPWEEVAGLKLEQLRDWLLPQIKHGSLEVAIVGDFKPEQMKELAVKYFGALGQREPIAPHSSTLTFPSGQSLVAEVNSSVQKSIVTVAWPTAGFWDIQRTRRLNVLAEILQDRLRLVIREKLGASYAPRVVSEPGRVYGDYGTLRVQVEVAPDRAQEILSEIRRIAEQLQHHTISADELGRVKRPIMTRLRDSVKSNNYWLYSVLANSTRHPQALEWPASLLSDYEAITAGEIEQLARLYLQDGKKATAIIRPEKKKP